MFDQKMLPVVDLWPEVLKIPLSDSSLSSTSTVFLHKMHCDLFASYPRQVNVGPNNVLGTSDN